jgi:predicted ATPase/DNA-binding SARP family transcriptional activator
MSDEVLCVRLLGAFSIALGDRTVADDGWRLRKARTLVKLLALAPDRRLHADQAVELLWPDRDPAAGRNNLHQAIFAARRALDSIGADGRARLDLADDLIVFSPDAAVAIDVVAFERAAGGARETREATVYRAALDAYGGELLPEDRYEEWTGSRRDALRELRRELGIELAELIADEDSAAAIGLLRDVLADDPLCEPAHRGLMRLYAETGRRQEALAQYQELKRGLRREFEDEPDDETRLLYRELLTRSQDRAEPSNGDAEPPPAGTEAPLALPTQLTSFVGRERELAEAAALLRGTKLLTLTGAGGCGKTRLALELAAQRFEDFADGVWAVELASVGEGDLIGPAIAQAMDMRLASDRAPEVALADRIGDRRQLLVLDNCEHLIEAVAHLVEALLRSCPQLTVLATSREPLRVPGEVTWRVPSLSLPALNGDAVQPQEAESVRLFAARAAQAAPGFELDDDNATAIATLCHRLDGMPLAIELAAARVAVLTPAQIVERLDDSLDLLSSGSRTAMTRQQTLRATLAWSFDLLDADEQVLLRRLAVFAGGFGLAACEEICGEQPLRRNEAVALLGRLADKSLVQVEEGAGERRFRLLETVRQYATERLAEADEREAFERRHREWYLALAESDPTPAGDLPARERLRGLDLERDNLRAALTSAQIADPQLGLRLAVALWRFWLMRGYLSEGYRWLSLSLKAAPEHTADRARALSALCLIGLRRGVHQWMYENGDESVAIFAELGDRARMFDAVEISAAARTIFSGLAEIEAMLAEHEGLADDDLPAARPAAWAAHTRGISAWLRLDHARAREQLGLALARVTELAGDPGPALWPLSYGMISLEPEVGYPLFLHEDTMMVARRVSGAAAIGYVLVNLAAVDRAEGEFARAEGQIEEAIARSRRLEDRQGEAYALTAFGNLCRSTGDFERGRSLLEGSFDLRREIGDRRGSGTTLSCLAVLLARSGSPDQALTSAERARGWFVENDDLIGLSAVLLGLATVALSGEDRAGALTHLEAATTTMGGMESTQQEGWALAVLSRLCAEQGDAAAARRWREQARHVFGCVDGIAGLDYCRRLEASDPT